MVVEQKIDGRYTSVTVTTGDVFQHVPSKNFYEVVNANKTLLGTPYVVISNRKNDQIMEVSVEAFTEYFKKDFALTNANKCAKNIVSKEKEEVSHIDEEELDNIVPEEDDFDEITSSICEMLKEKDKRYGNAALNPLEIFAKHHKYGARIDEKLMRVKNSEYLRKNDVADIIGGLILICKDRGWTDFSDQID